MNSVSAAGAATNREGPCPKRREFLLFLDELSTPILFHDGLSPDWGNRALARLLDTDQEPNRSRRRLAALAHSVMERGGVAAGREDRMEVLDRQYQVRITSAAEVIAGGSGGLVLSVSSPRVVLPSCDVLRTRFGLTRRESEIALLLARGESTKRIALRLGIKVNTARRHVQNVLSKVGVSARAAITTAICNGVVEILAAMQGQ